MSCPITQEALHSAKLSKQSTVILELDLSKAYYRVNWTFLRLVMDDQNGSEFTHYKLDNVWHRIRLLCSTNQWFPTWFFQGIKRTQTRVSSLPFPIYHCCRRPKQANPRSQIESRDKGGKSNRTGVHLTLAFHKRRSLFLPRVVERFLLIEKNLGSIL